MQIHNLETERCFLRHFTMDDIDESHMVLDVHPKVYEFDPGYQRTFDERILLMKNRIVEYSTSNGLGCLAVISKENSNMIGHCGLQGYLSEFEMSEPGPFERSLEIELYYKLHFDFWGLGYATEMCKSVLEYAFCELKIKRIVTVTDYNNIGSINLLKRLKMRIIENKKTKKIYGVLNNSLIQEIA